MSFILGWNLWISLWGNFSEVSSLWLGFSRQPHGMSPSTPNMQQAPMAWEGKGPCSSPAPPTSSPASPLDANCSQRPLWRQKTLGQKSPRGNWHKRGVGKNHSSGGPTQRNCLGFTVVSPRHTAPQWRHGRMLHLKGEPLPQTKYLSAS